MPTTSLRIESPENILQMISYDAVRKNKTLSQSLAEDADKKTDAEAPREE